MFLTHWQICYLLLATSQRRGQLRQAVHLRENRFDSNRQAFHDESRPERVRGSVKLKFQIYMHGVPGISYIILKTISCTIFAILLVYWYILLTLPKPMLLV